MSFLLLMFNTFSQHIRQSIIASASLPNLKASSGTGMSMFRSVSGFCLMYNMTVLFSSFTLQEHLNKSTLMVLWVFTVKFNFSDV